MPSDTINELDVVALTTNVPDQKLVRGRVGTVVRVYEPGAYEAEFVDSSGQTNALATLKWRSTDGPSLGTRGGLTANASRAEPQ